MPCPHYRISIISRGKGESVMAGAAYYAAERLYSERDHEWKYPHGSKDRVVYKEIMLPPNAPSAYADRQTLWNAVDAAERQAHAQTARRINITLPRELSREQNLELIRSYCQQQFVDRGMVCDLCYHDSDDGNPHVHLMLTLRAMDEQGRWLPKTKTAYVLDEQGQRVSNGRGGWLRERMDTVDWNEQKYCEIWRHEWEVMQNAALERAGRTERIDMRSFERQGVTERLPTQHLGPAASAMERKGIPTAVGSRNREIRHINGLIAALQKTVSALTQWIAEIRTALQQQQMMENPEAYHLGDVLTAYLDLRRQERQTWAHRAQTKAALHDLQEVNSAINFLKDHQISTVRDLCGMLNTTGQKLREMRTAVKRRERRIRDISAILSADKTLRELDAVWKEYSGIRWKSAKGKYAAVHADDLEKLRKAHRLLHKLADGKRPDRTALTAEAAQLEAENEAVRPALAAWQAELDELKTLRYWVRKVMPEALPTKTPDGAAPMAEQLEQHQNRQELERMLEDNAQRVIQHHQQEKSEAERQAHSITKE